MNLWRRLWSTLRLPWGGGQTSVQSLLAEVEVLRRTVQAQSEMLAASTQIQAGATQWAELRSRVDRIEERLFNYYRNRWDAIDNVADYLVGAEIPGDYMEFGVYKGTTFFYAYKIMAPLFPQMRFVAADSFEGLPEPRGIDAQNGYTSSFCTGQFAYSEADFQTSLRTAGLDPERVVILKGWFHETLNDETARANRLGRIAVAWIDCDLYESTIPVLRFLTPRLSVGSVVIFDDWRCFRNLPDYGQQRACREWLDANPQIALREFISFGFHGQAFTISAC